MKIRLACGMLFINIEINYSCGRPDIWQDMVGCDDMAGINLMVSSRLFSGIQDENWYQNCSEVIVVTSCDMIF